MPASNLIIIIFFIYFIYLRNDIFFFLQNTKYSQQRVATDFEIQLQECEFLSFNRRKTKTILYGFPKIIIFLLMEEKRYFLYDFLCDSFLKENRVMMRAESLLVCIGALQQLLTANVMLGQSIMLSIELSCPTNGSFT